jgi:hypothetical protein
MGTPLIACIPAVWLIASTEACDCHHSPLDLRRHLCEPVTIKDAPMISAAPPHTEPDGTS